MSKRTRHLASALVAFVLACASVLAGMTSARADVTIDPTKTGTLSIHKYLGAANTALPNDGSALTPAQLATLTAKALAGIQFDLYRVGATAPDTTYGTIDLTTNQGWLDAKALQSHVITAAEITQGYLVAPSGLKYTLTAITPSLVTNSSGTLAYSNLALGLYLVNENLGASVAANIKTPDGTVIPKGSITPSSPFLVSIPISYTDPNDATKDTWVYDINVYPKNTQDSIAKQVLDGNLGTTNQDTPKIGTNLTYRLQSTIVPATDFNGDGSINGADIKKYVVGDGLSPYVTYQSATLSIVKPDGTLVTALVAGTDYTVSAPAAGTAGGPVTFTFTTAGLDKLMAAKKADSTVVVRTDIVAQVSSLPATGIVPNKAYFIPSQGWYDTATNPDNGIPSNEVFSKYGDIKIYKTDNATTPNALAGAVFALYRDPVVGGNCSTLDLTTATALATSSPTNSAGLVEFSGYELSNWYNDGLVSGSITDATKYHNYCLVEVKAPAGFQLLAQPVSVSLTQAGVTVDVTDGQQVAVKNMPDNLTNNLPLTGGEGVATVGVLGLLLVGGGVGYYMVARRREGDA